MATLILTLFIVVGLYVSYRHLRSRLHRDPVDGELRYYPVCRLQDLQETSGIDYVATVKWSTGHTSRYRGYKHWRDLDTGQPIDLGIMNFLDAAVVLYEWKHEEEYDDVELDNQ